MKRYKKPLHILLSLLPYLTVFIFAMYSPSDPDLGWHLKYGEYFFQHGTVLRDNTFATLMPDYQWANTSWLTDVLTYAVFQAGGFLGLTLLGSLIITLTFFFFSRVAKLTLWDQAFLFPLLLYLEQPLNAISFRGQQLSLLLIGVLFYLLTFYHRKPKVLFLIVPLFLLWANLHGQFLFGIGLFAVWIALYILSSISYNHPDKAFKNFKQRIKFIGLNLREAILKNGLFLTGILIASVLVTVINPFGISIHTAALSHFGNPLLKSIAEYLPFEVNSQPWWNQVIVGIGLVLGFLFLYFRGKAAKSVPLLGVSIVVYILSFGVRRYAWPAYYLIFALLQPLAEFLKPDNKKIAYVMTAVFLCVLFGVAIGSRYPFTKYETYGWNEYCQSYSVRCSPESAEFLVKNKLTNNLYTLYSWGGYLIWNYPEIKPVIDGRMHLWKDDKGFSGFIDYYRYEQNMEDIDTSQYDTVYMSPDKPVYNRMLELVEANKWRMVYEDDRAGVFVRNK